MIRISKTDNDLITTRRTVNLASPEKSYMGGEFLNNSKDHIQLLIYDENENFLESFILDVDDYMLVNNGAGQEIRMKTGTILRKNGYDRGRFVLKFLFLRYVAGSDSTLLVKNDGKIFGKRASSSVEEPEPTPEPEEPKEVKERFTTRFTPEQLEYIKSQSNPSEYVRNLVESDINQ